MVTLNNDLQIFYDNMNGNINTLDSKAASLIDAMEDLRKFNSQFSDSVAYHYKGKVQKNTLKNLSSINDTITTITSSVNDKIYTSITMSKEILDSINELIELKKKINNGGAVNNEANTGALTTETQTLTGTVSTETGTTTTIVNAETNNNSNANATNTTNTTNTYNSSNDVYIFNAKQTETLTKLKALMDLDGLLNIGKDAKSGSVMDSSKLEPGSYKQYKFTASNGVTIDYWAYIPGNIEDVEGTPIHLHLWPSRSSESGGPMGYYNVHGLPRILYQGGSANGIVICPKIQADDVYSNKNIDAIKELTDSFVKTYNCDENRISVSGQGGGGQAAINFAAKYPDYFSKVVSLYSLDTAYNYDELGMSKNQAEKNLSKNDIMLISCTGGGKNLDSLSSRYTNQLYKSLKNCTDVDVYNNPHYIYGDDLFTETFTYGGKSYNNLLDYCFAQTRETTTPASSVTTYKA